MLSYMLPVEEKPTSPSLATTTTTTASPRNLNLNLNLSTSTATITTNSIMDSGGDNGYNNHHHLHHHQQQHTSNNQQNHQNHNNQQHHQQPHLSSIKENRQLIINAAGEDDYDIQNLDESCDENTKLLESESTHSSIIQNNSNLLMATQKSTTVGDTKTSRNINPTATITLTTTTIVKNNNNIINNKQNGKEEGFTISGSENSAADSGVGVGSAIDDECSDEFKNQLKKGKLNKVGTKTVPLKRVSFGSSKGSMVETLVFETPTPLPEHAERQFGFPVDNLSTNIGASTTSCGFHTFSNINSINNKISTCLDDSGIELQEELERSKVRVSFFQSSQPQQVSPPESYSYYKDSTYPYLLDSLSTDPSVLDDFNMTAATAIQVSYDRQQSTDSGWDNPFRPDGDLSREADEIVNMIKGGKPITPTGDNNHLITNGSAQKDSHLIENGTTVVDGGVTKLQAPQLQSAQNGTNSPQNNGLTTTGGTPAAGGKGNATSPQQTQVSNQVVPGPTSASHVVIEDKKKKKSCCVIQ